MDKDDLLSFNQQLDHVMALYGTEEVTNLDSESVSRINARRSIVSARAIKKGEVLDDTNLTFKRPGNGIPVDQWDDVVGQIATMDIEENIQVEWSMIGK